MRRDSKRGRNRENGKHFENKFLASGSVVLLVIAAIIISIVLYAKQLSVNKGSGITAERLSSLTQNTIIDENSIITGESTESASNPIGKTVEESKNIVNEQKNNKETSNNTNSTNTNTSTVKTSSSTKKKSTSNSINAEEKGEIVKKELKFVQPVEGEIVKEFAKDNLVYSKTLEEWVTHLGVDIKADKTAVVKAAEDGVIRSIKNDPRYGLTVVINHDNGYQTVYANLLTAEFVVEGESVTKGQTIGTVGNTATFEITDEPHLHFEILKDSENVDPSIYIKE